ncbi:MAG: Gfo/Idh/MocA family oxidoreductase [Bryobacteraceae bacterium]
MTPTRRTFTKAGSAAVVYNFVKGAALQKAVAANDSLGFGFIGTGIRGMYLLEEFYKLPGVKALVVADIYDGHHARAKEVTNGAIETTRDYRKVIERKDVDVVVIATPDHWHKQMALEALAAGKHVYLEKPMCWSIEQCIEVAKAADASGKIMQIGSGAGMAALTQKTRELIKSGAIGKVNQIRMDTRRNNAEGAWVYAIPPDASPQTIDWPRFLGPSPKKDFDPKIFFRWRCWWEYSGGVATDLFVHLLTMLHQAMDVPAPKSVVSQGGIYRWNDGRTVPDMMESVFDYDGFLANISVNLGNSFGNQGVMIYGSEGTLQMNSRGSLIHHLEPQQSDVQRYATNAWPKAMREAYFAQNGSPQRPASAKPKEIAMERGTSHQELFLECVRGNKQSGEGPWQGAAAAGAAHLANLSYRQGRRMSWDWKTGKIS